MPLVMARKRFYTLMMICIFLLGACGIKPGHVDAPKDADPKAYPKTYPPE